jgi:ferredoxin
MKVPVVELADCIVCGICTEVCPDAFRLNDLNYVEVLECDIYPEDAVNEAIKNCPVDCIDWQEQ